MKCVPGKEDLALAELHLEKRLLETLSDPFIALGMVTELEATIADLRKRAREVE